MDNKHDFTPGTPVRSAEARFPEVFAIAGIFVTVWIVLAVHVLGAGLGF
jgi:hypothetical protein